VCVISRCRGSHDLPAYIASKPSDLYWTPAPILLTTPPFLAPQPLPPQHPYEEFPSIDASTACPYYGEHGRCKYGFKCRFLGGHIGRGEDGTLVLLTDPERTAAAAITAVEKNSIEMSALKSLRRKEVRVQSWPWDLYPTILFLFKVPSAQNKRL
jgi:tRNA-dihydrouridine synthase 3